MGGSGSGRQMFWSDITKLDDGLRLDINKLVRDRLISTDCWRSGTLTWTSTRTGQERGNTGYEINTRNPDDMWLRLYYTKTIRDEKHSMDYKIRLTASRPHYGGKRLWFLCPLTGKRTSVLYCPPGSKWFASRHAYALKYQSQSEDQFGRAVNRKFRLQKKLDGENYYRKPKGMHKKTYDRLLREYWRAEQASDNLLAVAYMQRFGSHF